LAIQWNLLIGRGRNTGCPAQIPASATNAQASPSSTNIKAVTRVDCNKRYNLAPPGARQCGLRRDRHLFEFIAEKQSVKFRFLEAASR